MQVFFNLQEYKEYNDVITLGIHRFTKRTKEHLHPKSSTFFLDQIFACSNIPRCWHVLFEIFKFSEVEVNKLNNSNTTRQIQRLFCLRFSPRLRALQADPETERHVPNRTSRQAILELRKTFQSPQVFSLQLLKIIIKSHVITCNHIITRGQTYLWTSDDQRAAKGLIRSCLTLSCVFPSLKEYQRTVLSFELRNFYTNNIPHHIKDSTFYKSLAASSSIFGGSLADFRTASFLFLEEVLRTKM